MIFPLACVWHARKKSPVSKLPVVTWRLLLNWLMSAALHLLLLTLKGVGVGISATLCISLYRSDYGSNLSPVIGASHLVSTGVFCLIAGLPTALPTTDITCWGFHRSQRGSSIGITP